MIYVVTSEGALPLPWLDKQIIRFLGVENGGYAIYTLIVVLFSLLISGVIGLEREIRGHAAGLRTHIMVSLGATLVMTVSIIGFRFFRGFGANPDPFRLGAQVVSGIGFLGAGTIMQTNTDVKGLTTASTLWLCGGIGLAVGAGYVSEALIVGAICLIVLLVLGLVETKYSKLNPNIVIITDADTPYLKEVLEISDRLGIYIKDVSSSKLTYRQKTCRRVIFTFSRKVKGIQIKTFTDEVKEKLKPYEYKVNYKDNKSKTKVVKKKYIDLNRDGKDDFGRDLDAN